MQVTATLSQDFLKIYFDDVLHLSIYAADLLAVQSWVESESWYCIEYHIRGLDQPIHSQYDNAVLWKDVLKAIENYI